MPTEFRYDVFLSQNSPDKPRVRELAEVPATLRDTLLPKLLSGELNVIEATN